MHRPSALGVVGLGLIWWSLAGTGPWVVGLGGVLVASALLGLLTRTRGPSPRLLGVLRFIPYFLVRAFRGGVDVSLRALSPGLPLSPRLLEYRVRLPAGPSRTLFVNSISLLPGTFSANLEGTELTVHLLAEADSANDRLIELEERVAGIFGLDPTAGSGGG